MKDSGAYFIVRRLLDAKTKGKAQEIVDQAGREYKSMARELRDRLTFHRTTNQNALLHKWYGQIAKHEGDRSAKDVKGECHHKWALDIRLRDEQFAWVWERTGALLPYEKQCSLLASETLGISSRMTTAELKEYLDAIEQHYRPLGVKLAEPEDRK